MFTVAHLRQISRVFNLPAPFSTYKNVVGENGVRKKIKRKEEGKTKVKKSRNLLSKTFFSCHFTVGNLVTAKYE